MAQEAPHTREARVGFVELVLGNRNYGLLWSGQLISKFGDWIHVTALLWIVQRQTQSTFATSLMIVATTLGLLLAGPVAGALADRVDRRRLLLAADAVRAALVVLIPTALTIHLALAAVIVFVIACASAFFTASLFASIPTIVERRALTAANAYFATMDSLTDIAGTLAGGLVLHVFGATIAFYIDGGTYLVSLGTVVLLAMPAVAHAQPAAGLSVRAVLGDIAAGARYVRRHPTLWAVVLVVGAMAASYGTDAPMTALAQQVFQVDEVTYGVLLMMAPLGIFIASLAMTARGTEWPRLWLAQAGAAARGVLLIALAFAPSVYVAMALVFLIGAAVSVWLIASRTAIMEESPPEMVGRAYSFITFVGRLVPFLAALAYGWLADQAGPRGALGTAGAAGLALTVVAALLAAPGSWAASWRRLVFGRTSAQFDERSQRRLNAALAAIVLALWVRLLVEWPGPALGVAVLVAAGYLVAGVARSRQS